MSEETDQNQERSKEVKRLNARMAHDPSLRHHSAIVESDLDSSAAVDSALDRIYEGSTFMPRLIKKNPAIEPETRIFGTGASRFFYKIQEQWVLLLFQKRQRM